MAVEVKFKPFKAGETRSLLEEETANELVRWLNSLLSMRVIPDGMGKLVANQGAVVLDLTAVQEAAKEAAEDAVEDELPDLIQPGDLVSIDRDANGNLRINDSAIKTRLDDIEARLDGASISAVCNGDGTITVTLTL